VVAAILGFARGFLTRFVDKVATASIEKAVEGVAMEEGIVAKTLPFASKDTINIEAIVVPIRYWALMYQMHLQVGQFIYNSYTLSYILNIRLYLSSLAVSLALRLALASGALDTLFTTPLFLKKLYRALGGISSVAVPQATSFAQASLCVVLNE
jgi:hypothetical protein